MKAEKIEVTNFLGNNGRTFSIPVYQRNYDWKENQCIKLFNDIEKIVESNSKYSHFIGTIVYVNDFINYELQDCIIIDGQQRITSLSLLLKAIFDLLEDEEIKEKLKDKYLINKYERGDLKYKLRLVKDDFDNYKNLLENNINQIDKNGNVFKNYLQFKNLLLSSKFEIMDIYDAIKQLELVYIQLEANNSSENPQLIFESLNSTGLSLTQGDLIRNYLLMNQPYKEQQILYDNYWHKIEKNLTNIRISGFIRDYLIMKTGKIPNENKVYEEFKEFRNNKNNIDFNEEYFLKELLTYSQYYHWFLYKDSEYININQFLKSIDSLKSTVVYPSLLYFFEISFKKKKMSLNELEDILKIIISYLFRRQVCSYSTNALSKIFADICKDIEFIDGISYDEKILKLLTKNGKFPKNKEFREEFLKKNFYKKNNKLAEYTLFEIEKFNNKEVVTNSYEISIEHIMPQKLNTSWEVSIGKDFKIIHEEYLHTIGNLTLTGYNSELSNKNFINKKEEFKNSNFSITRNICCFEEWGKNSIIERAKNLYETAEKIWFLPEKYNNIKEEIDLTLEYGLNETINVTGKSPKNIIIENEIIPVNSWTKFLKTLCIYLYDLDKELFKSFIDDTDFQGKTKKYIDKSFVNMREPFELDKNLMIETSLSSNVILSICKLIAEKYNIIDKISFNFKN